MSNEVDKQRVRDAIDAHIAKYGDDVCLVYLRADVRSSTGLNFAGPTLAAMLKAKGWVRDAVRKIDTCPGKSTFYIRPRT